MTREQTINMRQTLRSLKVMRAQIAALAGALALGLAPAMAQDGPIAITGGTIHTLDGRGTIENGDILIEDGLIVRVGQDLEIPNGATVIEAEGRNVTPGLMTSYTQLGLVEISATQESNDTSAGGSGLGPSLDVVDAFNPDATLIPIQRVAGITRAISAPSNGGEVLFAGQGAVIHLGAGADLIMAPKAAMFANMGGSGAGISGGSRMAAFARLREALEDARNYQEYEGLYRRGATRDHTLARIDVEALIPVVEGRMPLAVWAHRAADIRALINLKNAYGLDMILMGGAEAWRVADALSAAGVPVVIDALANLPANFEQIGATLENAARLTEAGVKVALYAGGFATHNARLLPHYAGNAVAYGMDRDEALKAVTLNPAEIWGVDADYGSLTEGKAADVVIWDGDPLDVTSAPVRVLINGVDMPLESRQTRLRDRYRDLSRGDLPIAYR